ncbi:MAG: hypothetical protein A2W35_11235 [Chloroflexi bacterium RBG_16_57_11]|nr:MAG: hypothetical protein A2W35_11235 [Chloroflexi bacterium RBG_16_57_11]
MADEVWARSVCWMPIAMSVSLNDGSSPDPKLHANAANASGTRTMLIVRSVRLKEAIFEAWLDTFLSRIEKIRIIALSTSYNSDELSWNE